MVAWVWWVVAAHAEAPSAVKTIAASVAAQGLANPRGLAVHFRIRDTPVRLWLDGASAVYEREVTTDAGPRRDRLEGGTFTASVAGVAVADVPPEMLAAWQRSLNSIGYFTLLPRGLQDPAVVATALGRTSLRGEEWETIEVRFRADGGGEDHDDVFRYWFDPTTHRIAYLAYTFTRDEGGVRLREVTGSHIERRVVLHDYANYGLDGQGRTIDEAVAAFERGELPLVSRVELTDVEVRRRAPRPE
jgi:hypothetical protein